MSLEMMVELVGSKRGWAGSNYYSDMINSNYPQVIANLMLLIALLRSLSRSASQIIMHMITGPTRLWRYSDSCFSSGSGSVWLWARVNHFKRFRPHIV